MKAKIKALSPHSKKVLELLTKSQKPLSAYEILDKLRKFGIKAPPTVYRALDTLVDQGLIHKIESINAFVSCHNECKEHSKNHAAQFAVCRKCGSVMEIHDHSLDDLIKRIGRNLKFKVEQEMLELIGLCKACDSKAGS